MICASLYLVERLNQKRTTADRWATEPESEEGRASDRCCRWWRLQDESGMIVQYAGR